MVDVSCEVCKDTVAEFGECKSCGRIWKPANDLDVFSLAFYQLCENYETMGKHIREAVAQYTEMTPKMVAMSEAITKMRKG